VTVNVIVSLAGKNDGSVKGVRYFRCRSQHGVFVRHDKLTLDNRRCTANAAAANATAATAARSGKVPSSLRRSTGNLSLSSPNAASTMTQSNITASLMRPTAASSAKQK